MNDLLRRQAATEKTLARYRSREFDWRGGVTCVHLARAHLRNMGHEPPTLPRIRSALAAKRALTERGWASVTEMLDAYLPRIAPAMMLPGDLVTLPGDAGLSAVFVCAGPGRVFGWHQGATELVAVGINLDEAEAAWRV